MNSFEDMLGLAKTSLEMRVYNDPQYRQEYSKLAQDKLSIERQIMALRLETEKAKLAVVKQGIKV